MIIISGRQWTQFNEGLRLQSYDDATGKPLEAGGGILSDRRMPRSIRSAISRSDNVVADSFMSSMLHL